MLTHGKSLQQKRILGVDPGLQKTGWGMIEYTGSSLHFIACGTIKSKTSDPLATRLYHLASELAQIIKEYTPNSAAIEETFVNNNGASTLKLGQARGALLLTLAQHDLPVGEYAARMVKKAIVGVGQAEKTQVAHMVKILLPHARNALDSSGADALDALAIALTHAQLQSYAGKVA